MVRARRTMVPCQMPLLFLAGFLCEYAQALVNFDEWEAKAYAQYSLASFCGQEPLNSWTCGGPCAAVPVVPDTVRHIGPGTSWDVRGFAAVQPNVDGDSPETVRCVMSFRGSVSVQNYMADSDILMVPWPVTNGTSRVRGGWFQGELWCPDCYVHKGFADAYSELQPDIFKALTDLRCTQVALTGHSLGGAMATLAAIELRGRHTVKADPVYTFGQPRVGDEAFATAFRHLASREGFSVPAWRVVHYHDPVPRLFPLGINGRTYTHIPREVYYYTETSNAYMICDEKGEDDTCSNSLPLPLCNPTDHLAYLNLTFGAADAQCLGPPVAVGARLLADAVVSQPAEFV